MSFGSRNEAGGSEQEDSPAESPKSPGFNGHFFRRFWRLQGLIFPGLLSLPSGLFFLLMLVALLGKDVRTYFLLQAH